MSVKSSFSDSQRAQSEKTKPQTQEEIEEDKEDDNEEELELELGRSGSLLGFSEKVFLAMFIYIQSQKLECLESQQALPFL